jgi:hypothetical protein
VTLGASRKFLIVLTALNGVEFPRPKYFTGRHNGRWPEYPADRGRALRHDKDAAEMAANEFRQLGFTCEVRAA